MANSRDNAGRRLGGKIKFPGIGADARQIGVSAPYLWQCLSGRKKNDKLVADYWALKRKQARRFLRDARTGIGSLAETSLTALPSPPLREKVFA